MSRTRLEASSSMFRQPDPDRRLAACRDAALKAGFDFGIQIHNSAPLREIEWAKKTNLPLSAHLPILCEYNINLALGNPEVPFAMLDRCVKLCGELGITLGVFHGFQMTDTVVRCFGEKFDYNECMSPSLRMELCNPEFPPWNCDFTHLPEFEERRLRVRERLAEVRRKYPSMTLCLENDFPTYGNADLFGETLNSLENPLCFDTSHMWASCRVIGRDFERETEKMLEGGRVVMSHFHASPHRMGSPLSTWGDGHRKLSIPTEMNLPRIARLLKARRVPVIVFEIGELDADDIRLFSEDWNGGSSGR